jgi:hypothetical protein
MAILIHVSVVSGKASKSLLSRRERLSQPNVRQSRKAGPECPEHRFGPIAVLAPRRMHSHDEEQTKDLDDDVALAPAYTLASLRAPEPPFSVVFTVWLSMIPALGSRVRPAASRRPSRSVACLRSQTPARRQVRKEWETVW